jgi:hypothetical protein
VGLAEQERRATFGRERLQSGRASSTHRVRAGSRWSRTTSTVAPGHRGERPAAPERRAETSPARGPRRARPPPARERSRESSAKTGRSFRFTNAPHASASPRAARASERKLFELLPIGACRFGQSEHPSSLHDALLGMFPRLGQRGSSLPTPFTIYLRGDLPRLLHPGIRLRLPGARRRSQGLGCRQSESEERTRQALRRRRRHRLHLRGEKEEIRRAVVPLR